MIGEALHFVRPELVWVLWAWVGTIVAVVLLERRGSDVLDRLIAPVLQAQLVERPSRWRRRMRIVLLALAGSAMALALMRPQTGERFVATPRVGAEIMIAIDVSRSMLADDAKPSRLERAKAEIRDLLPLLGDDHVGLIAFAGRASVLSPMTPDKSFLRLALDGAGPHSVPRGGTKLAEAIRRAVVGFGEPGPAQRALILITDGEDHESFALDAAKAAAEAGVKIIAIGFGDEAGSPVFVRDPKTGASSQIRDAEGRPIESRLNGDLLRDLALATDGAFVPAGTGVLDLVSIYDAHISPLTRGEMDERGRTIRDEAYQICLVAALICLFGAVGVTAGRSLGGVSGSAALVLGALLAVVPMPQGAQAQVAEGSAGDATSAGGTTPVADAEGETVLPLESDPEDPRLRFNRANRALAEGDAGRASTLFRDSRREAPDDPELRYAATYNLGMAAVARADSVEGERPEEALSALHEAADWFREAVGLQSTAEPPRHNLEVVLRRALVLADEIARARDGRLEEALDAEIDAQRGRVALAAQVLEEVGRVGELDAIARLVPAFRAAATEQRVGLARADELADRVVREREAILAFSEESRSPQDTLRAVQLEGVLIYLDGAIDRMGQTRRQLRQRRAERAYRRGSAALGELKRARDQLRDPVEQIGVLLEETARSVSATAALASSELPANALSEKSTLPAFLTAVSLSEQSRRLDRRVAELGARLAQAAEQADVSAALDPPPEPGGPTQADRAALAEALLQAAPLVETAARQLEVATDSIANGRLREALRAEGEAGRRLADAQERFFDLARLIEVAHRDALQIAEIARTEAPEVSTARDEYAPLAREIQAKNFERATRLADELGRERARRVAEAQAAVGTAPPAEGAQDPVAAENERFDVAEQLLALAEGAMVGTLEALDADPLDWPKVGASAARAVDHLAALRSLFFSLVQHLQRLARDQLDLADSARDAIALAATEPSGDSGRPVRGPQTAERARALAGEQEGLEARAGAIADALLEQAQAAVPGDTEEAAVEEAAERGRRAAEHVASAQLAMRDAAVVFRLEASPLEPAAPAQAIAVEELTAALALLSPPPPEPEEEQDPERSDEGQGEEDSESPAQPEESPQAGDDGAGASETPDGFEESMQQADPSQLLQGVRDREAERRRQRERAQQQRRSAPVDKDW